MMSLVCALLLVSGLLNCQSIHASQPAIDYHEIYIDPNNPNSFSNASCYNAGKHHPCADINLALAFPERNQPTKFILSSDAIHHLENDSATTFADSSHVAFYSDNGTAIVQCMNGAGLAFVNYDNINISGISFQYCGAWRNSTSKDFTAKRYKLLEIRVALYFYNCRDVSMVNMSVLNSTEAVGVVMYSTAGVNYIGNSQFEHNRISESNSHDSGGGGFAVEFNYCIPGDDTCNETNHQTENNQNASYTFENCSFSYNCGVDQSGKNKTSVSILPSNNTHYTLGRGGGLSLYFKGNTTNNTITLSDCHFILNSAAWGAGMITEFVDSSVQNFVGLTNVRFTNNSCYIDGIDKYKGGPGGGMRVASFVYYPYQVAKNFQRNYIHLKWCGFISNRARFGGALSISCHYQPNSYQHQLFQAKVLGSSFRYNSARLGSAVSVDRDHYFTEGELGNVSFVGCTFDNNTIVYVTSLDKPYSVGIGALYISEVHVIFEQYLYFTENNGTALAIVGTTVTLADYAFATFTQNLGSRGGAIALLGMSSLVIGKSTSMTFIHNYASIYGGAIFNNYIGKEDLQSSIKCFLQYTDPFAKRSEWNTTFTFRGNSAGKLGQSIFSSTILPCSWSEGVEATSNVTSSIFCWNNSTWIYENSTCDREIHTFPSSFSLSQAKHSVYPGHRFRLHIQSKDDLEHNVSRYTIYTATTSNEAVAEVDPQYEYIADGYVAVNGEEGQNLTLELDTSGSRDWHVPLKLTLKRCPPGFVPTQLNNSASQTVCDCLGGKEEYTFKGNLFCDKFSLVSRIRNGYWIGTVPAFDNTTLLMGSTTLLHKFANQDLFSVAKHYERLNYNQCSYLNRTGPICGECIDNHSTAVNSYSYECVPCTSDTTNLGLNIFLYILLTYLPYLIVLFLILYFDIRLMSGPLIGFILYAQLIGSGVFDLTTSNLPYFKDDFPHKMRKAYRIAYGFFNLNSFAEAMDPFCVHEGFSALEVICLDYAVAAFPLSLILILYIREQVKHKQINCISANCPCRCQCHKRKGIRDISRAREQSGSSPPGRALIHPFAGFIYLSYTKFVLTSTKLMSTTALFDMDGEYKITLIYYAGHYQFGELQYMLPFGLLSYVIFIFFGIFLPVLLLGLFELIEKLIDKPRFHFLNYQNWIGRALGSSGREWRNAFRGCYKSNCYYFTGLYFLFRATVFIVFAFSSSEVTMRSWQIFFVVVLALLVARAKPYNEEYLNTWDVILFLNLIMINIVSGYLYDTHIQNVQSATPVDFYIIGLILIWWPMVYFLLYLFWLVMHKRHVYGVASRRIRRLFKREELGEQLRSPARSGRDDIETSDELTDSTHLLIASDERRYHAVPPPPHRPKKRGVIRTVVEVTKGVEGEADVRHTNVTGSSGVATGSSTEHTNTGSSQGVRVTDTD